MAPRGDADPVSALSRAAGPRRPTSTACRFCYELRLHRARGYGALKAILEILAEEEPLTLTEISQRLQRTPGSTKDYLSWLEDVDLVIVAPEALQLHRPAAPPLGPPPLPPDAARPTTTSPARSTRYALARLPHSEPALALAGAPAAPTRNGTSPWGIIEID